jgi:hypothetical protein
MMAYVLNALYRAGKPECISNKHILCKYSKKTGIPGLLRCPLLITAKKTPALLLIWIIIFNFELQSTFNKYAKI